MMNHIPSIQSPAARILTKACIGTVCSLALAGAASGALVAHYTFDETSGTTLVDSSGNGFNGSVVGSGSLNVAGTINSAYQPGGTGSYGVVTNGTTSFGTTGNSPRTFSLWFNTPDFGVNATTQNRLIGIGTGAAASFEIVAENGTNAGGSNRVGLRYGNGNVYFDSNNSGTAFAVNTWYHLAVVYDGTNLDLETLGTSSNGSGLIFYVNGVEVKRAGGNGSSGTQALNTSGGDFILGADSATGNSLYPGFLDDLQVYNNALNDSQVASLYNNPGSVIPEPSSLALVLAGGLLALRRRR
jgi:hypothetical protein